MFLVQDLVLRAMFSFVKFGSVFNSKTSSQLLIFSFFFDTIFSHNLFSFYDALSLFNAKGRTEDVNENFQHLVSDIPCNEQRQPRMKVKNKNTSVKNYWF